MPLHCLPVSPHKTCSSSYVCHFSEWEHTVCSVVHSKSRGYPRLAVSLHFTLNNLPVSNGDKLGLEYSRGGKRKWMDLIIFLSHQDLLIYQM